MRRYCITTTTLVCWDHWDHHITLVSLVCWWWAWRSTFICASSENMAGLLARYGWSRLHRRLVWINDVMFCCVAVCLRTWTRRPSPNISTSDSVADHWCILSVPNAGGRNCWSGSDHPSHGAIEILQYFIHIFCGYGLQVLLFALCLADSVYFDPQHFIGLNFFLIYAGMTSTWIIPLW